MYCEASLEVSSGMFQKHSGKYRFSSKEDYYSTKERYSFEHYFKKEINSYKLVYLIPTLTECSNKLCIWVYRNNNLMWERYLLNITFKIYNTTTQFFFYWFTDFQVSLPQIMFRYLIKEISIISNSSKWQFHSALRAILVPFICLSGDGRSGICLFFRRRGRYKCLTSCNQTWLYSSLTFRDRYQRCRGISGQRIYPSVSSRGCR